MEVILKVDERESVDLSTLGTGVCFIRAHRQKITEAAGIYMVLSHGDRVPVGPTARSLTSQPIHTDHVRCVSMRSGDVYRFPLTEQVRVLKAKLYVFGEVK